VSEGEPDELRIVGVVCSPRKEGNTEIMVCEALSAIKELGGETELITVADKTIKPCEGCYTCIEKDTCRINDDMQDIYPALLRSDGIILGTPVYFLNVTAQAKAVMDRTYALLTHRKLKGKVAGMIVVARRVGAGGVISLVNSYFLVHRMYVAGAGIGYGEEKGDIRQGVGGAHGLSALEEARRLGKAVARLHQRLSKDN